MTPGFPKTERRAANAPYSEDELADVLDKADMHAKLLLFLTAHAGLRISHALALEWEDLDKSARRIHVRSGKVRKARIVAMSTSLARATRHTGRCLLQVARTARTANAPRPRRTSSGMPA